MEKQLWPILKAQFSKEYCENHHTEQATSQVSEFTNTTINEITTIKNLMGTMQPQINQLLLKGQKGSIHTVTHNCAPGNHPPEKNESHFWTKNWARKN